MTMRLPIWLLLVVASVIAGSWVERDPSPPAAMRGGYRVLRADLHTHTRFGDGLLSPFELVLAARDRGIEVLAITEHAQTFPARLGRWYSRFVNGPTVLIGQEVTTHGYHLLAVGLKETIAWQRPLPEVIDLAHGQGAVTIAAHPTERYWTAFEAVAPKLDGTEVYNPLYHRELVGSRLRLADMEHFYGRLRKRRPGVAAIASSDYHFFNALGTCDTLLFARDGSAAAAIEAIAAGRTVARTADGRTFGDARLRRLIAREPLTSPVEPSYDSRGVLDGVLRLAGWIGLLGLVLLDGPYLTLGRRRRRA